MGEAMKVLKTFVILGGLAAAGVAVTVSAQEKRPAPERRARELSVLAGRGAEIGVSIRDLDPSDRQNSSGGVVVDEVRPDSAAEKAGLKRSDVIIEFDGEHVRSARQFSRLVQETAPGRTVRTTVLRDGKRVDLQVTPAQGRAATLMIDGDRLGDEIRERLGDMRMFERMPPLDFVVPMSRGRLGVTVQALTPQLADYFGAKDGVLVASVGDDSPAARAGIKAGDVITSINGHAVRSLYDLVRELADAGEGDATVGIVRDRKSTTVTVKIEPPRRTSRNSRPA
jgi:serine protease Do